MTWATLDTLIDANERFGYEFGNGPRAARHLRLGPPSFPELLLSCQLGAGVNQGWPAHPLAGREELAAWKEEILPGCAEVAMRSLNSCEFAVTHRAVTFTFRPDGTLRLSVPGLNVWNLPDDPRLFAASTSAPLHPQVLTPLLDAMHRWAGPVQTTLLLLNIRVTLLESAGTPTRPDPAATAPGGAAKKPVQVR